MRVEGSEFRVEGAGFGVEVGDHAAAGSNEVVEHFRGESIAPQHQNLPTEREAGVLSGFTLVNQPPQPSFSSLFYSQSYS